MIKILLILTLLCTAFSGGSILFAQKPIGQKAAPSAAMVQPAPHEIRSEEKREELSKKLMQRKNELRSEEHEHARNRRNSEAHEKSKSPQ